MKCSACKEPAAPERTKCEAHLAKAREASRKNYRNVSPEVIRSKNLKRSYGITVEQYDEMLAAQGGACAICGANDNYHHKGRAGRLAVDHDHETGRIRGILCNHCNRGIGMLKDDPDLLGRAALYLQGGLV